MTNPPEDQRPAITITSPSEFLASLPAIVGVTPFQSTVIVVFNESGEVQMTTRIDNEAPQASFDEMIGVINAEGHTAMVAVTDPDLDRCGELAKYISAALTVEVQSLFVLPLVKEGAPWMDIVTGETGKVSDTTVTNLAMSALNEGKVIYSSMAEIERLYAPVDGAVSPLPITEREQVAGALIVIATAIRDRTSVNPAIVGGALLFSEEARDMAIDAISISPMDAHAVFANAATKLRGAARVEALTAAGIAAYLAGEGVLVGVAMQAAFDTARLMEPAYESTMTELISSAYHAGVHPSKVKEIVISKELQ